jgi:hypothetical protein
MQSPNLFRNTFVPAGWDFFLYFCSSDKIFFIFESKLCFTHDYFAVNMVLLVRMLDGATLQMVFVCKNGALLVYVSIFNGRKRLFRLFRYLFELF